MHFKYRMCRAHLALAKDRKKKYYILWDFRKHRRKQTWKQDRNLKALPFLELLQCKGKDLQVPNGYWSLEQYVM